MKYRRYAEYKDSGVEWLGEVPAHWEVSLVKRRFAVELGKMLDQAKQNGSGTRKPYLRAANIHWDRLKLDDINEMEFSDNQMERYRLQPGDLLVTEGGVTVGRSALWHGELDECYYQNSLNRVRPLESSPISTRYLLYWMDFTTNAGYVDLVADKATFGHLTNEKLNAFPLVAPHDKEEVATIVAFLDHETAQIDALIAKQERLIDVLQEKRQALISHAVTKGLNPDAPMKDSGVEWLGEVPAHWEVVKFRRRAVIANGQVDPRADEYKDLILIAPNHVESNTGKILLTESAAEQGADSGKYLCNAGDVIYSKIRPALAKACIAPERCLCSADMYPIQAVNGLTNLYLLHFLSSPVFTAIAVLESERVAMPKINRETLSDIPIPVPPVAEQAEICFYVGQQTATLEALIGKAVAAVERLRERRATLISATVTGKINVGDLP